MLPVSNHVCFTFFEHVYTVLIIGNDHPENENDNYDKSYYHFFVSVTDKLYYSKPQLINIPAD